MQPIRQLGPSDGPALAAHLIRLDAGDRHLRFGRGVKDAFIRKYVAELDWSRSAAFAYVDGGEIRAVAQIAWPPLAWLKGAELALSVDRQWRRHGVATRLVCYAIVVAQWRGVEGFSIVTDPGNEAVRRLARRFGLALSYRDGTVEGYAPLPAELPAPCRAAAMAPRPGA